MTSMSLTVGSILFHKELLVFDKSSVVKSVQWGSCCCPLALLGTHSDINEIPLLTPLSTLEISHRLINRHSASLHVIYLPSCTLMSVWSTSFFVVALTHWSDWLDCLFNYKVCFMSYFAVHNVHHLCELILNPNFCKRVPCQNFIWLRHFKSPAKFVFTLPFQVPHNCSCDSVVTIPVMKPSLKFHYCHYIFFLKTNGSSGFTAFVLMAGVTGEVTPVMADIFVIITNDKPIQ